ncbi:GNAT family N-acetyltransferase [Elizabethkingia meningoseptica]|uniref:GNAT family N-acetyltransferase n=1 Tax=Elizabethkingia meningoseptica TaxID=238 RepID=UPI003892C9FB
MERFSKEITSFWSQQMQKNIIYQDETFSLAINDELEEESKVMTLECEDTDKLMALVTSGMAETLKLRDEKSMSGQLFTKHLKAAGIYLNGPDYIFYFSESAKQELLQSPVSATVRKLSALDERLFADFTSAASEQDLDDAYVELDHWIVFGSFEDGKLVSAASVYPWNEEVKIADLGVITLSDYRGRGHARNLVRAICKYACEQEYEPQYRCQLDNHASVALAKASGFSLFGKWDVISPDCTA